MRSQCGPNTLKRSRDESGSLSVSQVKRILQSESEDGLRLVFNSNAVLTASQADTAVAGGKSPTKNVAISRATAAESLLKIDETPAPASFWQRVTASMMKRRENEDWVSWMHRGYSVSR